MTDDAAKKLAEILQYNRDRVGLPNRSARPGDAVKVTLGNNSGIINAAAGTIIRGGQPAAVVKTSNGPIAIQGQPGSGLGTQVVINEIWEEEDIKRPLFVDKELTLILNLVVGTTVTFRPDYSGVPDDGLPRPEGEETLPPPIYFKTLGTLNSYWVGDLITISDKNEVLLQDSDVYIQNYSTFFLLSNRSTPKVSYIKDKYSILYAKRPNQEEFILSKVSNKFPTESSYSFTNSTTIFGYPESESSLGKHIRRGRSLIIQDGYVSYLNEDLDNIIVLSSNAPPYYTITGSSLGFPGRDVISGVEDLPLLNDQVIIGDLVGGFSQPLITWEGVYNISATSSLTRTTNFDASNGEGFRSKFDYDYNRTVVNSVVGSQVRSIITTTTSKVSESTIANPTKTIRVGLLSSKYTYSYSDPFTTTANGQGSSTTTYSVNNSPQNWNKLQIPDFIPINYLDYEEELGDLEEFYNSESQKINISIKVGLPNGLSFATQSSAYYAPSPVQVDLAYITSIFFNRKTLLSVTLAGVDKLFTSSATVTGLVGEEVTTQGKILVTITEVILEIDKQKDYVAITEFTSNLYYYDALIFACNTGKTLQNSAYSNPLTNPYWFNYSTEYDQVSQFGVEGTEDYLEEGRLVFVENEFVFFKNFNTPIEFSYKNRLYLMVTPYIGAITTETITPQQARAYLNGLEKLINFLQSKTLIIYVLSVTPSDLNYLTKPEKVIIKKLKEPLYEAIEVLEQIKLNLDSEIEQAEESETNLTGPLPPIVISDIAINENGLK